MVEVSVIEQGLNLMIYGMGTVFVFLTVLVFATMILSSFITRFMPEAEPELPKIKIQSAMSSSEPPAQRHAKAIAIIESAIQQHRAKP